ncbi:MAG TPA: hypothetical protein DDW50_05110 [Firmicutes bacterium]|jgi:hypothetical protein|nr:hypothetical protein [Bacillota bacterium]
MRKFNLSGIGLGIFLIGLGISYALRQAGVLHSLHIWLQLYPILAILLGLDFILVSTARTASHFSKPSPWMVTVIILIIIIGLVSSFCSQSIVFNLPQLGSLDGWDDWSSGRSSQSQFTVDQNFKLPQGITNIKVQNESGNIQINNTASHTIFAKAHIKLTGHHDNSSTRMKNIQKQFKFTGEIQDDTLVVKFITPDEFNFLSRYHCDSNIIIDIPKGLAIVVKSNAGNIDVSGIDGSLTVENQAGNVNIDSVMGNADIHSNAGQVEIKKVNGSSTIHCNAGNVNLAECEGPITAELRAGNLNIHFTKVSSNCDLDLAAGNLKLSLPANARFTIAAESSMGNIDSDFALTTKKEYTRATANGEVNGGGPLIRIRNSSGNIKLQNN